MASMDDPTAAQPIGDGPEPGDRRPVSATRLDRPPSDRYAREEEPTSRSGRGLVGRAVLIALVGAAVLAFLGGPLSMTGGLLAVALIVGLVLGAVLRPSTVLAVGLAVGSVAVGLLGVWLFARAEGGVLDPLSYFGDVQGPLAPLQLVVAALAAVASSR
jgi:hypothetical protein